MTTTSSSPFAPAGFTVTSAAFAENTQIPVEYSCQGRNVPPPLRWQNVPDAAESLALVVDDPDAPAGPYVHWVVTGIPPSTTQIVDGALPEAAVVSLNSSQRAEYFGPCPPAGTGVHHYRFRLYALSGSLTLTPTTPVPESTTKIEDQTLLVATTVGLFGD
jgi:Raf kinase inhibitor-like YbhB/YbcL family protein